MYGWLCGPAQPFSLPLPFCPPLLTWKFFFRFWRALELRFNENGNFRFFPPFPGMSFLFLFSPPPPFSPSLHILSAMERSFTLAQKKKNWKIFIFGFVYWLPFVWKVKKFVERFLEFLLVKMWHGNGVQRWYMICFQALNIDWHVISPLWVDLQGNWHVSIFCQF